MTDGHQHDHHDHNLQNHENHDQSHGHHEHHQDGQHHEHGHHEQNQNHEQHHGDHHHSGHYQQDGQSMNEQQPAEQQPVEEQVVARRRLGRGLGALLGGAGPTNEPMEEAVAEVEKSPEVKLQLRELAIASIRRNPNQPRKDFDATSIKELANSIKEHGVLQPIIVREFDGTSFQIVAGERRWLACQQIGRETIPCRVVDVIDKTACEYAFEENLKRQDLSDLEKAQAFKDYMNLFDSTVEELARQLSMSRSAVSNTMRLLDLPVPVKTMMQKGELTAGHARAILALKPEMQQKMAEKVVKQALTVRKTEEEVRKIVKPESKEIKLAENTEPTSDPHLASLESQLREMVGAKVEIKLSGKDVGKIIIHFENNDEFEGILGRLRDRLSNAA